MTTRRCFGIRPGYGGLLRVCAAVFRRRTLSRRLRRVAAPLVDRHRAFVPALLCALAAMACSGGYLRADTLTFDDLLTSGSVGSAIPEGYGGLDWSNFYYLNGAANPDSGYQNGIVSPDNVAYNGFGETAMTMNDGGAFTFNSAYFTAAWNDGLQVSVQGYNGSELLDSTLFTVNTSGPTLETFNWANINQLVFNSSGGTKNPDLVGSGEHFAMDNFAFTTPEPGALVLAALGAIGLLLAAYGRRAGGPARTR